MKKRIFCLILAFVIIASVLSSCGGEEKKSDFVKFKYTDAATATNMGFKYHSASENKEKIASGDFLSLYFDKDTTGISVCDNSGNSVFQSLLNESNYLSSMIKITVANANGVYELDSQDSSVAFGTDKTEKTDSGIKTTYVMGSNNSTANKSYENLLQGEIWASVPVEITLSGQDVEFTVNGSEIKTAPGLSVLTVSVMPYFGSSYETSSDDYILLPDNSGAVMHLDKTDGSTSHVDFHVYGQDPAESGDISASARIPAFGLKKGGNAFAAVIEKGDSISEIIANRANGTNPFSVYPLFNVTPVRTETDSQDAYLGTPYKGDMSVKYKFLTGSSADYSGMASAVREELINENYLSAQKSENDDLPFILTVTGSNGGKKLTAVSQAETILSSLKGKGLDNITLNLSGFFDGGVQQKDLYSSGIDSSLGRISDLKKLYYYSSQQNFETYLDVGIFSSSKSYSAADSALAPDNSSLTASFSDPMYYDSQNTTRFYTRAGADVSSGAQNNTNLNSYSSESSYRQYLLAMQRFTPLFTSFTGGRYMSLCDGISVSDAGRVIYSDKGFSREDAKQSVMNMMRSLLNSGKLSVTGGNAYALYGAENTYLDFDTFYPESDAYEQVPFSELVLHGYVNYYSDAIDAGDPLYRYEMLRNLEYGSLPHYSYVYSSDSVFYYGYYAEQEKLSEVVDFYRESADLLESLQNKTMVKHEKITTDSAGNDISGVYRTVYSDGTEIYINYNTSPVTTSDNIVIGGFTAEKVVR